MLRTVCQSLRYIVMVCDCSWVRIDGNIRVLVGACVHAYVMFAFVSLFADMFVLVLVFVFVFVFVCLCCLSALVICGVCERGPVVT